MDLIDLTNYLPIVGPIKTAITPDPKTVKFQTLVNTISHLFLTVLCFLVSAVSKRLPNEVRWVLAASAVLSLLHYFVVMNKSHTKLVRDGIPEIMRKVGKNPIVNRAQKSELPQLLNEKLREETEEFIEAQNIEELADLMEVVQAIAKTKGFSMEQIEQTRAKKFSERGGFAEGLVLTLK